MGHGGAGLGMEGPGWVWRGRVGYGGARLGMGMEGPLHRVWVWRGRVGYGGAG